MSRNVQHKSSAPAQKTVQKSSILTDDDSDDDGGYEGVDQISDDEEDEPDVEAAEEDVIRAFEDEQLTPRPLESDDEDLGSPSFFNEHFNEHVKAIEPNYSSGSSPVESPDRRVRFDLSDDSESGEDDFQDNTFFDLDSLAPIFRQMIDEDSDKGPGSDNGWWPSEDSEVEVAEEEEAEPTDGGSPGSSGYLTDEGETTDEDIPTTVHAPTRSVLRRLSEASSSEDEAPVNRRPVQRKVPRLAPFIHDGRKRYGIVDTTGNKLMMFGPSRRFSADGTTKRPQLQQTNFDISQMFESPMISNSGNLMMTAMSYDHDFSAMGGQAFGPSEAFFPFSTPTQAHDSSEYEEDSDPEKELKRLDIDTFIDFGDSDDEEENEPTAVSPGPSTPAAATHVRSEDQFDFLFNPTVVGAFRERHTHKNVKKRNHVSSAALAFESPYSQGPIQGLKPGRIRHANEPMTPMPRKLKASKAIASSPGSPLANVSDMNKKRKFSGQEFRGHKRNKSMV